jgi:hypothetical protein
MRCSTGSIRGFFGPSGFLVAPSDRRLPLFGQALPRLGHFDELFPDQWLGQALSESTAFLGMLAVFSTVFMTFI